MLKEINKPHKILLYALTLLIVATPILAEQPSQSYNKIFLEPFYVNSMTQNTNYNYNVSVITPDGITKIKSAILTLDAWINPTRTFNAWMNNIQCNTKNYTISTTYASAGRGVVTFDCTNAIQPNKINTVRYVVSGGNIGASTSWLEITYINKPDKQLTVHGTEYQPADNATVFIQLQDFNNNASQVLCELDIYNPTKTLNTNTMMTYLSGSSDIFYYDFIAGNDTGVYITNVECLEPTTTSNITVNFGYDASAFQQYIMWSNVSESNYYAYGTISAGATACSPNFYDIPSSYFSNDGIIRSVGNLTNINIVSYAGGTRESNITLQLFKYNSYTNTYVIIGNTSKIYNITNTPTGFILPNISSATTFTSNEKLVGSVCYTNNGGGGAQYRFYWGVGTQSNFSRHTATVNISTAFIYRGSGEVHVNNKWLNATDVWNYTTRNLTYYAPATINASEINISINYTLISQNVWEYTARNLTFYEPLNTTLISNSVWNYPVRNLTYYVVPDYILQADYNWNYTARYTHGVII